MEDKDRDFFFLNYLFLLNPSLSLYSENQPDMSQELVTPQNHVPETVLTKPCS